MPNYEPRPKQVRVPSEKSACKICNKQVFARGMHQHIRLAHPEKPNAIISGIRSTKLEQHKAQVVKEPKIALDVLLVWYGIEWLIKEISKSNEAYKARKRREDEMIRKGTHIRVPRPR